MIKLFIKAILRFFLGLVLFSLLIFIPAGTIQFSNAWLLIIILFVPMFFVGIAMMIKCPELLEKRLNTREELPCQKVVLMICAVVFAVGLILSGLTFRFDWYRLPSRIVWVSVAMFLIGYILYGEVIRENKYLSRIIEVQEGQKVVDTGLYRLVRHPMYSASLLVFLSMPLILGSIYGFLVFLIYPFAVAVRIKDEERYLKKNLAGYKEYMGKVKYRLIPFIW